jgi:hypothetical protein
MRDRARSGRGFRLRSAVALVALLGQLSVTLGLPLPAAIASRAKRDDQPFPCQGRPCGCLTAEECWRGDCCCFTLEEKLAWADAEGIEPPAHVRPLVESRKRARAERPASCCAQKPCCGECCHAEGDCCREPKAEPTIERREGRWVVGVFARKCRGEGPQGLFDLGPSALPDLASSRLTGPDEAGFVADRPVRLSSTSQRPPTPPPRGS